jgi:hypothetical protein
LSSGWQRRGSSVIFYKAMLGPLIVGGHLVSLREALGWLNRWPSDPPGGGTTLLVGGLRLTREGAVAACYEAGVSGYDLYRQITACGVACQVIAPALTPRRPGQRIKTDRRDATKLVRLFRAGELTAIHVPDEAEEAVRDLTRCREDVRRDVLRWRQRLLKFLDRHGRLSVTARTGASAIGPGFAPNGSTWPRCSGRSRHPCSPSSRRSPTRPRWTRRSQRLAEQSPYRESVGWLRGFPGD